MNFKINYIVGIDSSMHFLITCRFEYFHCYHTYVYMYLCTQQQLASGYVIAIIPTTVSLVNVNKTKHTQWYMHTYSDIIMSLKNKEISHYNHELGLRRVIICPSQKLKQKS